MIKEIEQAIEQKIGRILASERVQLEAFPDNPRDFGKALRRNQVLVGYNRSTYRDQSELPKIEMIEVMDFSVYLSMPSLRTHQPAYPLLDAIKFGLLGFVPIEGVTRKLRPVSQTLSDFDPEKGVWEYSQLWRLEVPIYEGMADNFTPLGDPDDWEVSQIVSGVWRSIEPIDRDTSTLDRQRTISLE